MNNNKDLNINQVKNNIDNQMNNQNQINNIQNQSNNIPGINTKFTDEEFKKFVGSMNIKNGYTECMLCSKYFPKEYKFNETCAHCWAFCFCDQFNVEKLIWKGDGSLDKVKDFIKNTWKVHPKSCTINDCIYNKITKLRQEGKLDKDFSKYIGMEIENPITNSNKLKFTNISNKRDVNINFKLSSISI